MVVLSRAFLHEHFLFFTYFSYHTTRTLSTSRTQDHSVDKLRHQESLWREDLQSGGNPLTATPTGYEPKELATVSRIEASSGDPYQLYGSTVSRAFQAYACGKYTSFPVLRSVSSMRLAKGEAGPEAGAQKSWSKCGRVEYVLKAAGARKRMTKCSPTALNPRVTLENAAQWRRRGALTQEPCTLFQERLLAISFEQTFPV